MDIITVHMQVIFMKSIRFYFAAGLIFTAVLGTLMHYFYGWSVNSPLVALISPVGESTWEHMKLLFFPVLFWSFFLPARLADQFPSVRPALLLGGLAGTLLIPVLFYTYTGILGYNVTWTDIAIFFICVFVAFVCAWVCRNSEKIYEKRAVIYALTALFSLLFFLFTFLPPDIGLFAEP